jgi:long-chain acyl-CoA synthetase
MLQRMNTLARPATFARIVALLRSRSDARLRRSFQTLVQLQQDACAKFAERPFLGTRLPGKAAFEWMTYRQVADQVLRAQNMMQLAGVGKGSVVAIIANNRREWAIAAYAAFAVGARYVPMYEAMKSDDWVYILNDCKATLLFAAKIVNEKAPDLQQRVPSLISIVEIDAPAAHPNSFDSALARGVSSAPPPPAAAVTVVPSDIATIIYTSGTTGKPKGVCLSHDNIVSNISSIAALLRDDNYSTLDRHSSFLPWAHIYGHPPPLSYPHHIPSSFPHHLAFSLSSPLSPLIHLPPSPNAHPLTLPSHPQAKP